MAIVRYRIGEGPQTMTPEQEARLAAMTPEEIEANALSDPDNPPSTEEELERGVWGREVRLLRLSLGLDHDAFAARFGFDPARVRDWECGRILPDSAARASLRVIAHDASAVDAALPAGPRG